MYGTALESVQSEPHETKAATTTATVATFSKEQILKSEWYSHRRDALNALLKDGETYSTVEINKMIDEFMKGKVK